MAVSSLNLRTTVHWKHIISIETKRRTGRVVDVFPNKRVDAMRPKARGLVQHGGPPGWLEESDPAGRDFIRD